MTKLLFCPISCWLQLSIFEFLRIPLQFLASMRLLEISRGPIKYVTYNMYQNNITYVENSCRLISFAILIFPVVGSMTNRYFACNGVASTILYPTSAFFPSSRSVARAVNTSEPTGCPSSSSTWYRSCSKTGRLSFASKCDSRCKRSCQDRWEQHPKFIYVRPVGRAPREVQLGNTPVRFRGAPARALNQAESVPDGVSGGAEKLRFAEGSSREIKIKKAIA